MSWAFSLMNLRQIFFGQKDGYTLYIENKQYRLCFSVREGDALSSPDAFRELTKDSKVLTSSLINHYKLTCSVKAGMTKEKTKANIIQGVQKAVAFLRERGFSNVCEQSGETGQIDVYQLGGNLLILSPESFSQLSSGLSLDNQTYDNQKENIVGGIVGAFIGSLIGGALILLLAQMGYVAFAAGLAMGFCTIKGYELLGKKLSRTGIIISVVLMIIVIFGANQLDYALLILREYPDANVFDAFTFVNEMIFSGQFPDNYWFNIILLYVFTGAGAFGSISSALSHQTQRYVTRKL
ncbi:hypothetical protein STRDD11_02118 [Streptococcus sp. DD11]|nr:hypothetical protein STRDD11_02118 [Streptococcus sp. DD11]